MSKKAKMMKGKIPFSISPQILANAEDMTYLLIRKLHGWNNGTDRAHLFQDFGFSDGQYSEVYNMFISYQLLYPKDNIFENELWKVKSKQELVELIDFFIEWNILPETAAERQDRIGARLAYMQKMEEARKARIQEKFGAFEDRLFNPLPDEKVTTAYTSEAIQDSDSEEGIAF